MKKLSVICWILTTVLHLSLLFSIVPEGKNSEVNEPRSLQKINVTLEKTVEVPKPTAPVVQEPQSQKLTTKKVLKKRVIAQTIITDNLEEIDTNSVPEPEPVQVTELLDNEDYIYSDSLITVSDETFLLSILDEYKLKLSRQIAAKKSYPKKARRLNQTGVVKILFNLAKDGTIIETSIHEESPYAVLNASALETIAQLTKLEKIPDELNCDSKTFVIPLVYTLK